MSKKPKRDPITVDDEHDGFDHCQGCQAAYQSREGAIA
jgi:hypothetical protein